MNTKNIFFLCLLSLLPVSNLIASCVGLSKHFFEDIKQGDVVFRGTIVDHISLKDSIFKFTSLTVLVVDDWYSGKWRIDTIYFYNHGQLITSQDSHLLHHKIGESFIIKSRKIKIGKLGQIPADYMKEILIQDIHPRLKDKLIVDSYACEEWILFISENDVVRGHINNRLIKQLYKRILHPFRRKKRFINEQYIDLEKFEKMARRKIARL